MNFIVQFTWIAVNQLGKKFPPMVLKTSSTPSQKPTTWLCYEPIQGKGKVKVIPVTGREGP
jgi:hypothetical protein